MSKYDICSRHSSDISKSKEESQVFRQMGLLRDCAASKEACHSAVSLGSISTSWSMIWSGTPKFSLMGLFSRLRGSRAKSDHFLSQKGADKWATRNPCQSARNSVDLSRGKGDGICSRRDRPWSWLRLWLRWRTSQRDRCHSWYQISRRICNRSRRCSNSLVARWRWRSRRTVHGECGTTRFECDCHPSFLERHAFGTDPFARSVDGLRLERPRSENLWRTSVLVARPSLTKSKLEFVSFSPSRTCSRLRL